ncbi:MAG: hypothetical protein MUO21_00260 [Nitrososphaeraceae archaeon]|nr:hypothetical protein [Nitrososphaeraceae archaeon]
MVFDLTKRLSFNNIEKWVEEIEKNCDYDLTHIELLIIGNKSDLIDKREVFDEDIKYLHDKFSFVYLETSAKDNVGINEGLTKLTQRIHNNRHYIYKHRDDNGLALTEETYMVSDNDVQSGCRCVVQ